jgi:hypothetical protein
MIPNIDFPAKLMLRAEQVALFFVAETLKPTSGLSGSWLTWGRLSLYAGYLIG